jgi:hypothetical protein
MGEFGHVDERRPGRNPTKSSGSAREPSCEWEVPRIRNLLDSPKRTLKVIVDR